MLHKEVTSSLYFARALLCAQASMSVQRPTAVRLCSSDLCPKKKRLSKRHQLQTS